MKIPVLVIGGGLSGIAAAIRIARFTPEVQILEQHSRMGGLNSYFYRNKRLFETGLHAITNYAEKGDKTAPLNRLFRQLKLRRKNIDLCQQRESRVQFGDNISLRFSNDFQLLKSEIEEIFPDSFSRFTKLVIFLNEFDPFTPAPFRSTKMFLKEQLQDHLLVEMLLCPLMYYGSSHENDMDLGQFAIMFRAIYLEGMFRPASTIKDFLDMLMDHYEELGGSVKTRCRVKKIIQQSGKVQGVELETGEFIECDYVLSTIGSDETRALLGEENNSPKASGKRLGFIETIFELPIKAATTLTNDATIIFYNNGKTFNYASPTDYLDTNSGVICFPGNFQKLPPAETMEIRSTHLASYDKWKTLSSDPELYLQQKEESARQSRETIEKIIGSFENLIIFENSFTPTTIERYTSKIGGAIYGNPEKVKDGDIGYSNLFLAGTDQGFLGIVGSMLSGVSIVNQHILPKL